MAEELLPSNVDRLAERLFRQLKRSADDVIVSTYGGLQTQIKFANNQTAKAAVERSSAISIFFVKEKRVVFTTLKEPTLKSANRMAQELPKAVRALEPSSNYYGITQGKAQYEEVKDGYDPKIVSALEDGGMDYVDAAINAAHKAGGRRTNGVLELYAWKSHLRSSGGADGTYKGTKHYLSLRALNNTVSSGHQVAAGRMLSSLGAEKVGTRAGQLAFESRSPAKAPAGVWDVVLDTLPWAALLGRVGDSASVFNVESGFSFLTDKIGQKVGSSAFTLHDDGRLPDGFASSPFDAEGTPTQRTTIIDKGTLRSYLHNASTAKKHGTKSTGNAGLVAPGCTNLVQDAGRESTEKLISRVKRGLFISNVWYTRFQNYAAGDFSTIPRDAAFLIRNGHIEKPVRGLRISENFIRLLSNVEAVSSEREQVHGWEAETPVLCGPALIRKVRITRPSQ